MVPPPVMANLEPPQVVFLLGFCEIRRKRTASDQVSNQMLIIVKLAVNVTPADTAGHAGPQDQNYGLRGSVFWKIYLQFQKIYL